MVECGDCGRLYLSKEHNICPECGSKRSVSRFSAYINCPECGTSNPRGREICKKCKKLLPA